MKVQKELTKLYYSIGEVGEMFGVSNSLIRHWESEFSALKPSKNRKGDRRYTVNDIHQIERIYTLVKERGFTLDGARKELKTKNSDSEEGLLDRLLAVRKRLSTLHSDLEKLYKS